MITENMNTYKYIFKYVIENSFIKLNHVPTRIGKILELYWIMYMLIFRRNMEIFNTVS